MKNKFDFLLSEYEERVKALEDSLEQKVQQLGDVNKRLAVVNERIESPRVDAALEALKKVLNDPEPEVTEKYVRIRQKPPGQYVRMRTITISSAKGIKAVIGFKKGGGSEVQSYLFDKKKWTIATAKKWIAEHKGDSLSDMVLFDKLKTDAEWTTAYINTFPNSSFAVVEPDYKTGKTKNKAARHLPFKDKNGKIDLPHLRAALARMNQIKPVTKSISVAELRAKARKVLTVAAKANLKSSQFADELLTDMISALSVERKNVDMADSIMVDEWIETDDGVIFKDVVFTKEMVQKYPDGMHYKPASELKAALDSFRGKPVVGWTHPKEKVVTSMKQQVGHIVFDSVKWDEARKRAYGDIFIKKDPKNQKLIDVIKKKRLEDNSIGFRCDIVKMPGEFQGQHYDYVQKNFFMDHLALVYQGRATSRDGVGINAF